jgi:glycosyltransferase involved in cell wall biosynthesis
LSHEQPEIFHTHLVHADWHGALVAIAMPRVTLVSTKHNHDPFRTGRLFTTVEKLAASRCDGVISISASLADFTQRCTGMQTTVVHYGLPCPPAPQKHRAGSMRRLISVGRLEEQKGHDVLIEAFAAVLRTHPDLQLTICGDGPARNGLIRAATRLGIADRVEFAGWRHDVATLLAEADLLVHPARWEGFGLVLLEAMRAALPIVATRVGAIPEVISDGVTGILVAPEEPEALAAAIRSLADDGRHRLRLGAEGFERLRNDFSPARMAAGTVRVYQASMQGRHKNPLSGR